MSTVWIITEGHQGSENQCLALTEALGLTPEIKRIMIRPLWARLPAQLWIKPLKLLSNNSSRCTPPWPDIIISCGRKSAAIALAIKRANQNRTFLVHIHTPFMRLKHFDLIIAPKHDGIDGDNVIVTHGALQHVTQSKLAIAAKHFAPQFAHLSRPRVAVLIGGKTSYYKLGKKEIIALSFQLRILAQHHGASLMITVSRRSAPSNAVLLQQQLDKMKVPYTFWDGRGENPYLGYLALADAIVVTSDSVSMISEACATGKPVYIFMLPGGRKKSDIFFGDLYQQHHARLFTGHLETWPHQPLDEMSTVVAAVRKRLPLYK